MTRDQIINRRLAVAFFIAFAGTLTAAFAADEPLLAVAAFVLLLAGVAVA